MPCRETETELVSVHWGRCGAAATRSSEFNCRRCVCDVNSQIVMATAGTADSGATAPTGI